MQQQFFKILSQKTIAKDVIQMELAGDTAGISAAGQFVNIRIDGLFLRRPISVCDYSDNSLTLIYKIIGKGTEALAKFPDGTKLDLLTGLGNGYHTSPSGDIPMLIGGGAGVPPLYRLCKNLIHEKKKPQIILGFNGKSDVFFENEFKELGVDVCVTTVDGSYGVKGFVTDAMKGKDYSYTYACGPEPMLKAIYHLTACSGQYSFEERMGCGFGACMGCSCKTKYGFKRICRDGPVLEKEEIIW